MPPFEIAGPVECFLLPNDGAAAEQLLLQHLNDPSEMYIDAYAFTLVPMADELLDHFQAGDPLHLYADYSESLSPLDKAQLKRLVDAGAEVTIGTSPAGRTYIAHAKALVCLDSPPFCWEGSTNFSASAWKQGNTVMTFASQTWADQFIAQFKEFRQFAWTNERALQLMPAPPPGVG